MLTAAVEPEDKLTSPETKGNEVTVRAVEGIGVIGPGAGDGGDGATGALGSFTFRL